MEKREYTVSESVSAKPSAEAHYLMVEQAYIPGNEEAYASPSQSKLYLVSKRVFDVVSSLLLLMGIWPVFLVIAIAVKIDSQGPVFFKHKRVGQHGRTIYLYKFRTMKHRAEEMIQNFSPEQMKEWQENFKLENDPRVTRFGRFLRRSSLDELPQLYNIFAGTLSVVGPRPVVTDELEKYGPDIAAFLSVKPGLTGYWQAYARSDCDYDQRIKMELHYVKHANFIWDFQIIWATVWAVIYKKGAK